MANDERELVTRTGLGSQGVMCSCKGCKWQASVKSKADEVQKAFESHRCEDFPEPWWKRTETLFKDLLKTDFKYLRDCGPTDYGLSETFVICEREGDKKYAISVDATEINVLKDNEVRDLLRSKIQDATTKQKKRGPLAYDKLEEPCSECGKPINVNDTKGRHCGHAVPLDQQERLKQKKKIREAEQGLDHKSKLPARAGPHPIK
jgi:hypothetical protein